MNIKEAKEEIKNAMRAYFARDEFGSPVIPVEKQRPVFLMGPPGIGKTAIMEQIASEMGVGLVSYSMTHHTRQSALGLPFIVEKNYGGKNYSVSEYTMSEIISSVYEMMEASGLSEGILFLDEINCVSETLAPSMLEFLQYKVFGRHRVPEGWIVVTAGNPPEYNSSVREFDIVTWDRLKRIDVEADYDAWKEYALSSGIHPAVSTYLEIKKGDFYKIESTVEGKSFVTARGWSDLSAMIKLYEELGIDVTENLIVQYLQNRRIAKDFAVYYDLFNKYRSDYRIDSILRGEAEPSVIERAASARFDERLSLIGLMLDAVTSGMREACLREDTLKRVLSVLRDMKDALKDPEASAEDLILKAAGDLSEETERRKAAGNLSEDDRRILLGASSILEKMREELLKAGCDRGKEAFDVLKGIYDGLLGELRTYIDEARTGGANVFRFSDSAFRGGQELLILVTELTINSFSARFISRHGLDEYFAHNRELLFYERQKDIIREIEDLGLDDDVM